MIGRAALAAAALLLLVGADDVGADGSGEGAPVDPPREAPTPRPPPKTLEKPEVPVPPKADPAADPGLTSEADLVPLAGPSLDEPSPSLDDLAPVGLGLGFGSAGGRATLSIAPFLVDSRLPYRPGIAELRFLLVTEADGSWGAAIAWGLHGPRIRLRRMEREAGSAPYAWWFRAPPGGVDGEVAAQERVVEAGRDELLAMHARLCRPPVAGFEAAAFCTKGQAMFEREGGPLAESVAALVGLDRDAPEPAPWRTHPDWPGLRALAERVPMDLARLAELRGAADQAWAEATVRERHKARQAAAYRDAAAIHAQVGLGFFPLFAGPPIRPAGQPFAELRDGHAELLEYVEAKGLLRLYPRREVLVQARAGWRRARVTPVEGSEMTDRVLFGFDLGGLVPIGEPAASGFQRGVGLGGSFTWMTCPAPGDCPTEIATADPEFPSVLPVDNRWTWTAFAELRLFAALRVRLALDLQLDRVLWPIPQADPLDPPYSLWRFAPRIEAGSSFWGM